MYVLRRITTAPGTALRILVDQPEPDSPDAGFTVGGSFMFEPAGQDGDRCSVSDHVAGIVMGDRELSKHFECSPPWKGAKPTAAPGGDLGAGKVEKKVMLPGPDLKKT